MDAGLRAVKVLQERLAMPEIHPGAKSEGTGGTKEGKAWDRDK